MIISGKPILVRTHSRPKTIRSLRRLVSKQLRTPVAGLRLLLRRPLCLRRPLVDYGIRNQSINILRTHSPRVAIRVHAESMLPAFSWQLLLRGIDDVHLKYVVEAFGCASCSILERTDIPDEYELSIQAKADDCVCDRCYQGSRLAAAAEFVACLVRGVHVAFFAWAHEQSLPRAKPPDVCIETNL